MSDVPENADVFEVIRKYSHIAAVISGLKPDQETIDLIICNVVEQTDPFYLAFPDEDKGFYPHLSHKVVAIAQSIAQSK